MSLENNIEELFKSKLESFESPVNEAMWTNISSSVSTTSALTASSTSLINKLFSTTGIAIGTGVLCTIATVLVMSSGNSKPEPQKIGKDIVSIETGAEINQRVTNDDELAVSNILKNTPVDSNDPSVKEKKAESFIVVPSNHSKTDNSATAPSSIINAFLTPKSRIKHTEPVQEPKLENKTIEEKEITIVQTQEGELIATIIASPVGGYAPLDVYFSNPATHGSVLWNFGDGTSSEDFSPSHTFEEYGTYTIELIVTDASGKEKKDYRVIEVEANSAITILPNVFTPNGDGINDLCAVKGKHLATFQMKVFNRSGDVIFESQSIDNSWDGKNKFGEDIPTGTYFYLISARGIDGKVYEHTGPITLSR
ncbi:gliding motility-associated C-terminal domain-containing protein [Flavobacteriales bacterium]|nr:gliding motility-associated C-terminal domain-containing protein [Flavobacteriales bacterium]